MRCGRYEASRGEGDDWPGPFQGDSIEFWFRLEVAPSHFEDTWVPIFLRNTENLPGATETSRGHIACWVSIFAAREGEATLEIRQVWATDRPEDPPGQRADRFYPDVPIPSTWIPDRGPEIPGRVYCPYRVAAAVQRFDVSEWGAREWHHVAISTGTNFPGNVGEPGPVCFEGWLDGEPTLDRTYATIGAVGDGIVDGMCYFETFPYRDTSAFYLGDVVFTPEQGTRDPVSGEPRTLESHPPITIDSLVFYAAPGAFHGPNLVPVPSRFESSGDGFFEGLVEFPDGLGPRNADRDRFVSPIDLRVGMVSWTAFLPTSWGVRPIEQGDVDVQIDLWTDDGLDWQPLGRNALPWEHPNRGADGSGSLAGFLESGGLGDGQVAMQDDEGRVARLRPRIVPRDTEVRYRVRFVNRAGIEPLNVTPVLDDLTIVFWSANGSDETVDWSDE